MSDKLVRCPVHSSYYREADGCPRCQQGEGAHPGAATDDRGSREEGTLWLPYVAAAGLVAAGAFWWLSRPAGEVHQEAPATAAAAERTTVGLDPEPYRAEIQRIESILQNSEPDDFGAPGRLEDAVRQLANRLAGAGMLARTSWTRMVAFGARVGSEFDAGYQQPDVRRLADDWAEVRDQSFRQVGWFAEF